MAGKPLHVLTRNSVGKETACTHHRVHAIANTTVTLQSFRSNSRVKAKIVQPLSLVEQCRAGRTVITSEH